MEGTMRTPIVTPAAAALVALLLGSMPTPTAAAADPPDADAIVARSLQAFYYAGEDMAAHVSMRLISARGVARQRELSMLRRNLHGGRQQFFSYFQGPPDVREMSFLVHKYPERDDDRWIYIPALKQVRRLAAQDRRSSFVGSDFTYEDMSGREAGDERHRLLGEETLGERSCYVIEGTPVAAASFAARRAWIDKQSWLPLKEEYLDAEGKVLRTFSADEIRQIDGLWTITRLTMANARTGHRTEVVLSDVSYNVGLGDATFSEVALRSPPRKWLR
jgi:outer membrane lipoprotein-sorting protein